MQKGFSEKCGAAGRSLRACCPNGTERGCPSRSTFDNSKTRGILCAHLAIRAAAAGTAALRRLQNDLGNTPLTVPPWRRLPSLLYRVPLCGTNPQTPCRLVSRRYSRFVPQGGMRYEPARPADWWQSRLRPARRDSKVGVTQGEAGRCGRLQQLPRLTERTRPAILPAIETQGFPAVA